KFVKKTSISRIKRNNTGTSHYADREESTPARELFLNDSFPNYLVSNECTHSGKPRTRNDCVSMSDPLTVLLCVIIKLSGVFNCNLNILLRRDGGSYFLRMSVHNSHHTTTCERNRTSVFHGTVCTYTNRVKYGWHASKGSKNLRYIWNNTTCDPDMVDAHSFLALLKHQEDLAATLPDRVAETLDMCL
ncbi:hypothetical protein GN958_ATG12586, partial [Phytophthora infestans]